MLNINGWEAIVLIVVFILVFGPERLPEAAVRFGRLVRELREAADTATADLTRELELAAREVRSVEDEVREAAQIEPERTEPAKETNDKEADGGQAAGRDDER